MSDTTIKGLAELQRALQGVVQATLHDQPNIRMARTVNVLVQALLGDVALRRRDALQGLELLVAEGDRRVRQAHVVEAGRLVDQQDLGVCGQSARQFDALLGAERQAGHHGVGDVVEVEVQGLGVLRNPVAAADANN